MTERRGQGNDFFDGGGGDDTLVGGQGNNTLRGGVGNDAYFVNNIGDQVVENPGAGNDRHSPPSTSGWRTTSTICSCKAVPICKAMAMPW